LRSASACNLRATSFDHAVAVANMALAGLGTAATLANRDDTSSPAATTSAELADISQACMA
jgi:hypothetical protein